MLKKLIIKRFFFSNAKFFFALANNYFLKKKIVLITNFFSSFSFIFLFLSWKAHIFFIYRAEQCSMIVQIIILCHNIAKLLQKNSNIKKIQAELLQPKLTLILNCVSYENSSRYDDTMRHNPFWGLDEKLRFFYENGPRWHDPCVAQHAHLYSGPPIKNTPLTNAFFQAPLKVVNIML